MTYRWVHSFWHCILNSSESKHLTYKNYLFLYRGIQGSLKGCFPFLRYQSDIRRSSSSEMDIEGLKRREKLKTFKTLQYNITWILYINSSNRMFCSIHNFTFLMIDTKIWGQVFFKSSEKKKLLPARFSVKLIMLPAQSIMLANWFACMHRSIYLQCCDTNLKKIQ